ncbi:hypothetical protein FRX31_033961, partial [Thalictrum thalictroides]
VGHISTNCESSKTGLCYNCGEVGHRAATCTKKSDRNDSGKGSGNGEKGHGSGGSWKKGLATG